MSEYPTTIKLILILKENGKLNLEEIANKLSISKMAALNHLKTLEEQGIISRKIIKKSVGRPSYLFFLNEKANSKLGSSSEEMLSDFMKYMKKTGNEKMVEDFLNDRYKKILYEYREEMATLDFNERLKKLTLLRQRENYYPELKRAQENYEIVEFNCPILSISSNFGIACSLETNMFSNVLDADVKSTHRQINGNNVCRFLIKKKNDME